MTGYQRRSLSRVVPGPEIGAVGYACDDVEVVPYVEGEGVF